MAYSQADIQRNQAVADKGDLFYIKGSGLYNVSGTSINRLGDRDEAEYRNMGVNIKTLTPEESDARFRSLVGEYGKYGATQGFVNAYRDQRVTGETAEAFLKGGNVATPDLIRKDLGQTVNPAGKGVDQGASLYYGDPKAKAEAERNRLAGPANFNQNNPTQVSQQQYQMTPSELSGGAGGITAYNARIEALRNPPTQTPITTGIPNTNTPTPNFNTPQAPGTQDSFYTSLSQQLASAQQNLDNERNTQLQRIQQDKQAAQAELDSIRSKQQGAIDELGKASLEEKNMKLAQLEKEEKRFDEEYQIQKNLGTQLTNLMTEGNALVQQMKGVTGLASIRNPRINQTIEGITASVGVIQAALSVSQGLTSQAQQQLTTATNVITSAYSDSLDYYKTLSNFYESKASDSNSKLITLTSNERTFLDNKIQSLQNDMDRVQANSDALQAAMTDPDTALAYATAGVSLLDSPQQISQKLAKYTYQKELISNSNEMSSKGYTPLIGGQAPAGSEVVQMTDSQGNTKTYYKKAANKLTEVSPGATLFDPITGKAIFTAPTAKQLGGGSGGGTIYDTKPLSILDVQRYQELYPGAGINAGDSEASAIQKIQALSQPRSFTTQELTTAINEDKTAKTSYEEVIAGIDANTLIANKDEAKKVAAQVYGKKVAQPTYGTGSFKNTDISSRISQLKSTLGASATKGYLQEQLRKDGYSQDAIFNATANIGEKTLNSISNFLFKK